MDKVTIVNLLTNSGLTNIRMDDHFIYFDDPSCIFPAFDTLFGYVWMAAIIFTAILLFGWGFLYIKNGVKISTLFNNAKVLLLILGILSITKPIVNFIYGDNILSRQCETKQVTIDVVEELFEMRNKNFGNSDQELQYEIFDVIDTGAIYDETNQSVNQSTNSANTVGNEPQSQDNTNAVQNPEYVIYTNKNGERIKRSGGSVSWRQNNPGNIINSKFARQHGALDTTGKFAVFPDEETGTKAIRSLLRSDKYNNLSIKDAIHKWAPAADNNNPEGYTHKVEKYTGLSATQKISSLSEDDLTKVVNAIRKVEDWDPGREQKL